MDKKEFTKVTAEVFRAHGFIKIGRKFDKSIPRCPLCMRSGNGAFDNWREIYFDDRIELDIFRIFEKRGRAYCNERFVTFCAENHFTNMIENCYPVKRD